MVKFEDPRTWPKLDAIGGTVELSPALILHAYRHGVFPMPFAPGLIGWFSPMRRGILPLDGLRVSRSLRKSAKRYRLTVDQAFGQVLARCADPARPHGWIDEAIARNYAELHHAGIVHSVEAWDAEGRLCGGLYGVNMGGLFAGESMFHDPVHGRDASKAALIGLVDLLTADGVGGRLLDVQWRTDHLASLGVIEVPRDRYLELLSAALELPAPEWVVPD
ncbi:leucyl/phenylalanyl-tRNA--protein transferase [Granulicoccus sp. GXG6511]|uniref:leucyl/phenylalanyl-tRNA--protein transferase n=1 Tax=Granulicoccus sp. GXG6511 TaxID=3381351 RepID=UPI003D7DD097